MQGAHHLEPVCSIDQLNQKMRVFYKWPGLHSSHILWHIHFVSFGSYLSVLSSSIHNLIAYLKIIYKSMIIINFLKLARLLCLNWVKITHITLLKIITIIGYSPVLSCLEISIIISSHAQAYSPQDRIQRSKVYIKFSAIGFKRCFVLAIVSGVSGILTNNVFNKNATVESITPVTGIIGYSFGYFLLHCGKDWRYYVNEKINMILLLLFLCLLYTDMIIKYSNINLLSNVFALVFGFLFCFADPG